MNPRPAVRPPRLAARLVAAVLPPAARAAVVGDLDERFRVRVARGAPAAARRWYWRQAIAFAVRVPMARAAGSLGRAATLPTPALTGLTTDLRMAARTIRRRPGLALTAIVILGVAVGATTTVFSTVHAILIERLPFPNADRLVMLWDVYPAGRPGGGTPMPITLEHYRIWSGQQDLFSEAGAYESIDVAVDHGGWPERIDAALVTSSLLRVLGLQPTLGRSIAPEDEAPGAEPVAVLGHGLWSSRFGGDPAIVGRLVNLNGRPTRVIGVAPETFWFYDPYSATRSITGRHAEAARLWMPLRAEGIFDEPNYPRYRVVARLRDGISLDTAADAAAALRRRLPPTSAGPTAELRLVSLSEQVVAESRPRLLGLFGAVSLVLLIACVNLVSLLLVHLESRRSELAVRVGLGAGRGRLARQLVFESTLLGFAGGVLGLFVAALATGWLVSIVPRGLPLAHRVGLDATIVGFGLALGLVVGLVIGLVSTLTLDPRRLAGAIAAGARAVAGSRSRRRLHSGLVAAEVAFSLVLLIAATLLLRSLVTLRTTDTGFDPDGVLTFEVVVTETPDGRLNTRFFADLEDRLENLPGVAAAGGTTALPFSRWVQRARVTVAGGESATVDHRLVSPGYFEAVGVRLRSGRGIETADREGSPLVAVVNEALVQRALPEGIDPIGKTVSVTRGRSQTDHTIVGVVGNVKHSRLFERDQPILYAPVRQMPMPFQRFAVSAAAGDPLTLVDPIRRLAAEIDPDQPLQAFITFEDLIAQSIEEETFFGQVVGAFAATAVLLTLAGIYGVVSYATRQRDREVGIRMALGAGAGRVHRLILRQALVPIAVGLAMGWMGARAVSSLLQGLLHGVPPHDPASFSLATLAFVLVALVACALPARRAARLDPVQVLRD